MFPVGTEWNPLQAKLRDLLTKGSDFEQAKALLLHMHAMLHQGSVYGQSEPTLMDMIWEGLAPEAFVTMPTADDVTIAWNTWHITRIEDLTANLLIAGGSQVLDSEWLKRLQTVVTDTGNAMTDKEILSFSKEVDQQALRQYRNAVGRQTKNILKNLTEHDLKRKFPKDQVDRILAQGGVTEHPDSIWLLDFWGRKNVAGILLMPITRHQMGHLNDCLKLKEKCARRAHAKRKREAE